MKVYAPVFLELPMYVAISGDPFLLYQAVSALLSPRSEEVLQTSCAPIHLTTSISCRPTNIICKTS